jgi:hypothetical protein
LRHWFWPEPRRVSLFLAMASCRRTASPQDLSPLGFRQAGLHESEGVAVKDCSVSEGISQAPVFQRDCDARLPTSACNIFSQHLNVRPVALQIAEFSGSAITLRNNISKRLL